MSFRQGAARGLFYASFIPFHHFHQTPCPPHPHVFFRCSFFPKGPGEPRLHLPPSYKSDVRVIADRDFFFGFR